MPLSLLSVVPTPSPHDSGVREIATFSGRVAYVTLCLALAWGVLAATGWIQRTTGHQTLRGGHVVLATVALATGLLHALSFLLLDDDSLTVLTLIVPIDDLGHAFGVVGMELLIAVAVAAGLRRVIHENRLRFHQVGYVAVALLVIHAWFGAVAGGHLAVVWLGGITAVVPALLLSVLRLLPPHVLVRIGLLGATPEDPPVFGGAGKLQVRVDDKLCHRYGVCQAEAPKVFQLHGDGLEYVRRPGRAQVSQAEAAARACPMRAITLQEAGR
ncbi:ferredoxin [Amycolatopsis sp. H20-H5]|uniref:ferredoxin n=1 Tax=Amycolatopsis sp. H20-H5 TaxID=3046309 RepID=UPI002DB56A77|nr:ferredoxin [Amycolatopsis sp. H20-H5]MEC3982831.1 ferredoxin [Amycolatopsis sp. H20-H5]